MHQRVLFAALVVAFIVGFTMLSSRETGLSAQTPEPPTRPDRFDTPSIPPLVAQMQMLERRAQHDMILYVRVHRAELPALALQLPVR